MGGLTADLVTMPWVEPLPVQPLLMAGATEPVPPLKAQRAGDSAAVVKLITADFEQRNSAQPGQPTPRADWRIAMREQWQGEVWIEQMAVHERGDTALVSFLVRPGGKPPMRVVDAWVRAGDGWQLKVRYLAPSAG